MFKRHLTLIIKVDNPLRLVPPTPERRCDAITAQFQYFAAQSPRSRIAAARNRRRSFFVSEKSPA